MLAIAIKDKTIDNVDLERENSNFEKLQDNPIKIEKNAKPLEDVQ